MAKSSTIKRPASVVKVLRRYKLPADFPLSPHEPTQRWYRKIRGKRHYFGPLDDPDAALQKYMDQRDALIAGRAPSSGKGATVADVLNAWLNAKDRLVSSGELRPSTFDDYRQAAIEIRDALRATTRTADLQPPDFGRLRVKWARRFGPTELGKHVAYVRSIFKHAFEAGLIDATPRFGPEFRKAKASAQRRVRQSKPRRMIEATDLLAMIEDAGVQLKAMILLGINCGWGNTDIAELPKSALDLKAGVAVYPRAKTGIARRAILWPETVKAVRAAIDARPDPLPGSDSADARLVFITKYGNRWVRYRKGGSKRVRGKGDPDKPIGGGWIDSIGIEFDKLLVEQGVKAEGVGFYSLRHTFRTVADQTRDFPAIDLIMGHTAPSNDMSARYRERIDDDRLQAIADHVHHWLYGAGGAA